MRWVGDRQPLDEEQCQRWLEITAYNYCVRGYGMFAIVERASEEVIGFCGLVHPDGQPDAELKYAFKRQAWGQGYATEAANALVDYGACVHGLKQIIATVEPEHLASHKVLLKVGLQWTERRTNEDGSHTDVYRWTAVEA